MRVSVDDDDDAWTLPWIIFVDGVHVPYVRSFDTEGGWVLRYDDDPNRTPKMMWGKVEVYRTDCVEQ